MQNSYKNFCRKHQLSKKFLVVRESAHVKYTSLQRKLEIRNDGAISAGVS
ncbi:hypothetical protein HMPREF0860_1234 [Treponema socranskii subsp. socranskii VPI DR56BR1116 = ATCC 35536]|uniref:Uncharacterized protein n=1 Tax=Treponema socranskii subsp. socranskii VPI DR56BR1116 = ATCC 35536 TaxID=1125725 RepID=U1GNT0_TRESO|nr:hypothetical protein HMPREF1325_1096 [Treponema socranskii subsp. socranskii VPI DR56BR1116 = ATCC 35536]ERK04944.1 hypothetical protein HMPREF0860_1234 [Treponema socranskii subsp. socranskii VPI DR56BR1116 = ATCC 35536]